MVRRLLPVALVAATLLAYANCFTDRFTGLDARESIRDNPHIRQLWPLTRAMSLPLLADTEAADEGSKGGTVVRRPILSLSFALNYALSGPKPNAFHATNLAIHITAGLFLFAFVRRTVRRMLARTAATAADGETRASWLAFAVALLWLVHPLQTESVTYIVQRAESLMGCLFLGSLYSAVRGIESQEAGSPRRARRLWYGGSVLCSALAIATKEVAVVIPAVVLVYDATFVAGSVPRAWRARRGLYLGLVGTWAILGLLIALTLSDVRSDFTEGRNLEYALVQPRVILHYLRVALWPDPLYLHINTALYEHRSDLEIWSSIALVACLAGLTVWALVRRRWYGFAGAWFFGILAPSSTIVAVSDVVQEHRLYLSLAALLALGVVAAHRALEHVPSMALRRSLAALLLASTTATYVWFTYERNGDYHSEFGMIHPFDLEEAYTILARHFTMGHGDLGEATSEAVRTLALEGADVRDRTFAHYLLGTARETADDAAAAAHFEQALALKPDFATARGKLAEALLRQGKAMQAQQELERIVAAEPDSLEARYSLARALLARGEYDAAMASIDRILAVDPLFAPAHNVAGRIHEQRGEIDPAVASYRRALELDPLMHLAYHNLARVLEAKARPEEARATLERGVALYPDDTYGLHELARLLDLTGDYAGARARLEAVLVLAPENAAAHSKLAAVLEKQGDFAGAEAAYARALAIDPDHIGASNALGTLLARAGRYAEAIPHFERVLAVEPDNVAAHANLGALLASQGRTDEAIVHLERTLRLAPSHPQANFNLGLIYEGRGEKERARRHFERELEINPGSAAARDALARLG